MSAKISKDKIQQLFSFKANRAVDILFTENKIDHVHDIYASLQQHKKNNTHTLKKTLESNYQKMLYCSDLLNQARKYVTVVHDVAARIEAQIKHSNDKAMHKQAKSQNQVDAIQKLLSHNQFHQAMSQCNKKQKLLAHEDRYFIQFLRIEVISKMERHMCMNRLTQATLNQYSHCLKQFLFSNSGHQIILRQNLDQWGKDFKQKSILRIASKKIQLLKQIKRLSESLPIIYEILYQYKLKILKNRFKSKMNSQIFEQYFEQLAKILKIYRSAHQAQDERLGKIFEEATSQLKAQLSSIFIQRKQSGQIVFKNELYDELIKNPHTKKTIENFYQQISRDGAKVEHPLKFINQLWHDYFINLIDLSLEQASPLIRVASLKQHLHNYDLIPDELKLFLHDYSLEQSINTIKEYGTKIQLLRKNLLPIVSRCTPDQLIGFSNKFNQKVLTLGQNCLNYITHQIKTTISKLSVRKYLLLRIQCGIFQSQIQKLNQQTKLQLIQTSIVSIFHQINLQQFWHCFAVHDKDHYQFAETLISFDCFFVGYIEGFTHQQHTKTIVSDAIAQTSMKMLTQMNKELKTRQKQTLEHTVQSLKQKKQKVTILQKLAVPYLADKIFCCEMKPIKMDDTLYNEHFVRHTQIPTLRLTEKMGQDEFEIGEKEEKQQLVPARKGKSIMNIGNNFITGFIKKK